MGEMKFKQRPREEQAEADGTSEAEKVRFSDKLFEKPPALLLLLLSLLRRPRVSE